jgi:hypothetical protein
VREGYSFAAEEAAAVGDDFTGRGDLASAVDDAFAGVIAAHDVAVGAEERRQFVDRAAIGAFLAQRKIGPSSA